MGGAERNARKKRQARTTGGGSPAVAAARSGRGGRGDRKKVVIGVVVVLLLLGAVLGGVIYTNNKKNATEGQEITAAPDASQQADDGAANLPASRDGGVVVVGEDTAEVTLDVYEDFLCPACRSFEERYGKNIDEHVRDGNVRVRYHMLPMLNERSDPPGYSMDSANAGLCAADAGKFPAYHRSLFANQPAEGSRGWDRAQLAKLGTDLGITSPDFTSCVESGKYDDVVRTHFAEVGKAPNLQQEFPGGEKGFGTPTLAVDEKVVEPSDAKWLDKLVASASS